MRKLSTNLRWVGGTVAALAMAGALAGPAQAGTAGSRVIDDKVGDAPPAVDISSVDVHLYQSGVGLQIHVDRLPGTGTVRVSGEWYDAPIHLVVTKGAHGTTKVVQAMSELGGVDDQHPCKAMDVDWDTDTDTVSIWSPRSCTYDHSLEVTGVRMRHGSVQDTAGSLIWSA